MARKTRDTNIASIYFTQKRWTRLDTVAVIMISIGAAILIFWNGYGATGIPLVLVGAILKIFCGNARVSDADYDEELEKLVSANYIETHRKINDGYNEIMHKLTVCNYFIDKAPVIVGKDHRPRSHRYCIATFEFKDAKCALELFDISIPEKQVSSARYSLDLPCSYELIEETSVIPNKKSCLLKLDGIPAIPVDPNATDTDVILKALNGKA